MREFEKQMEAYKKMMQPDVREEKVQETIRKSREAFFRSEETRMLSYGEFVRDQFRLIRKRWWVLQFLLLCLLGLFLVSGQGEFYIQRAMGICATLFVILIIPELWKNRTYQSMEIESAAYYSLRQIYAARMLLFGLADILLLSVFIGVTVSMLHVGMTEILIQFLLPMTVSACICFGTLCGRRMAEAGTVTLCILWSSVWMFIVLNENIYTLLTVPVWLGLLVAALAYLGVLIYHALKRSGNYWEVSLDGIEIK